MSLMMANVKTNINIELPYSSNNFLNVDVLSHKNVIKPSSQHRLKRLLMFLKTQVNYHHLKIGCKEL